MPKQLSEYTSPPHKLLAMLKKGRDQLREKYRALQKKLRRTKNQAQAVTKWRDRAEAAEAELAELKNDDVEAPHSIPDESQDQPMTDQPSQHSESVVDSTFPVSTIVKPAARGRQQDSPQKALLRPYAFSFVELCFGVRHREQVGRSDQSKLALRPLFAIQQHGPH